MVIENYNVEEDEIFISLCSEKIYLKILKKHLNCLKNYTNYHQFTLEELVDEAEEEENNVRLAKR